MTGGQLIYRNDTIVQILNAAYQNLKNGQFAETIDLLEKVLEADVEYPGAASTLKCASFWKERLEKERVSKETFEKGEQLLGSWRVFQSFAERLPDVPERFVFAIKQFVFSAALSGYLAAVESEDAADPDVLFQIGRCCKGIGNYERAIEYLERANNEKRDDARILAELADCYSLVNETRSAKVFFREAFFIDPQAIDLSGIESPLIVRLAARLRDLGYGGVALAEWVPVYGAIWGIFTVKRELKPLELGKLKQSIHQLEKDVSLNRFEVSAQSTAPAPTRDLMVPRLLNRYFWLIDHFMTVGEQRDYIDDVLAKVRELDPRVYADYTT